MYLNIIFKSVVYNEWPAVYPESQKTFLKLTENTSKTCGNVCLSKSDLPGKDFTFPSLSVFLIQLLVRAWTPSPTSFFWYQLLAQPWWPSRSSPILSSQHVSSLKSLVGEAEEQHVSCWWRDEKRNKPSQQLGKKRQFLTLEQGFEREITFSYSTASEPQPCCALLNP